MSHPPEGRGVPSWCFVCGDDEGELRRVSPQFSVFTCDRCRTEHFAGLTVPEMCQSCGYGALSFTRDIGDDEPVSGICDRCREDLAGAQDLFKSGGILFRCNDCGARGHLLAEHEKAKLLRKRLPAPAVAGVTLTREHGCPKCGIRK